MWSAESRAAVEAVAASAAALAGLIGAGAGPLRSARRRCPVRGADPLRSVADGCLDGLAEAARLEARTAALKVRLAADYARATGALAPPAASPPERTAQAMAMVAEVACVLTVSERTAGALLSDSLALTTALPLALAALQAGTISWQHARIIVEETSGLEPSAAAGLEAHFLDPGAPSPARGCPAGDLIPSRFRAKARAWRERHHPVSIEQRHAKSAADRRVDFAPDRDGMAWLSAYLPADTAAGIWERTTAAARALQGPDEARNLSQLRADVTATWLLTNGTTCTGPDGGTGGMADAGTGLAGTGGGGAGGGVPSPRAQVLITVPVLSLLGAGEEPAVLDGYGPIPPSMARRLITGGADSFYRVLTDPRDGAPLEIGLEQLPGHEGPAPLAPAPRRQVPVPRLRQPLPGQRGRPPPGLGRRRHHRHLQPGPAVPEAPPAETRLRLATERGQQGPPAGVDLTVRTALPERGAGLGAAPLAGPPPGHGLGHGPGQGTARGSRPGPAPGPLPRTGTTSRPGIRIPCR